MISSAQALPSLPTEGQAPPPGEDRADLVFAQYLLENVGVERVAIPGIAGIPHEHPQVDLPHLPDLLAQAHVAKERLHAPLDAVMTSVVRLGARRPGATEQCDRKRGRECGQDGDHQTGAP